MEIVGTVPFAIYFELLLDFVAPVFIVYFLFLMQRPFFHRNLRILLTSFSLGLLVLVLSRIAIVIDDIFVAYLPLSSKIALHTIHAACILEIMDASVLLALERVVATWTVSKYEEINCCLIPVGLCVIMWLCNGGFAYFVVTRMLDMNNERHIQSCLIGFSIALLANCIGLVVFIFVNAHNRRCWTRDLQKNLTHRYQIKENVRTSQQLLCALLVDFAVSIFMFGVMYHQISSKDGLTKATKILSQAFDIVTASTAILMPSLFIRTHPRLSKVARKHLCGTKKAKPIHRISSVKRTVAEEGNLYFSQLAKSWDLNARR
ncbi:hypothetical protein L596_019361 [Steinernema carpocapsae]|uniref:G-protein coupled receptors family 1 profile domain-containing protein n=1 Tax=Steinernema carpocapsae TaxID=34508 RepID=A0A4V6A0J4_STECR|nr:hypothetical protein L596_019361 [Steinernema carpocapsae]